jgi:hypothetical protein
VIRIIAIVVTVLGAAACKSTECGDGTLEVNGICQPADNTVGAAMCGPFTELVGDKCVPQFPPTVCDNATTSQDVDQMTGVTTCIGTGGGFACPTPASGKQTICGQLFDVQTNMPFAASTACAQCTAATASGPCSIAIRAFDAIAFASNPATAVPLATGPVYIDDCGRYVVPDITLPGGPFIGLGIDDADAAKAGPLGSTNTVGVATPALVNSTTKDFEAFVAAKATTDMWASSGGPALANGIYMMIFRAARTGSANQPGVTVTRNGGTITSDDFYFQAADTGHNTVDAAAGVTGMNGTALVINGLQVTDLYSAQVGPLPPECRWESHAGKTLANILFVQLFRPTNALGKTCPL